MAKFKQPGAALDFVAPSGGVIAGNFYKINDAIVFAGATAAEGEIFAGYIEGTYSDCDAATSQSWGQGAKVYWDDSAKKFTTTASTNAKAGIAAAAKGSSAALGEVRLIPTI